MVDAQPSSRSWTSRLFRASGVPVATAGIALFALGSVLFAAQELVLGRFALLSDHPELTGDMRGAITHIVIVSYLVAAFAYYEQVRDEVTGSLGAAIPAKDRVPPRKGPELALWGLAGVLVAAAASTWLGPGPASYRPADWTPETAWHRVLGLAIGFSCSRLFALIIDESGRFSSLARGLPEIDLLAPERLAPFVRLGMTGALLAIGTVATFGLFLVDVGYLALVGSLLVAALGVGAFALFLPLRGLRERIHRAKQDELRWCRERLHHARDGLRAGRSTGELEELVAWEARIEAVPEWAIDSSTLTRFALYLLIPLGSWAGGALVERMIDSLLD